VEASTAPDEPRGDGIVNAAFAGTGAFVALAIGAAAVPDRLGVPSAVLACCLFAAGVASFLWAYALGVSRSRDEAVTVPGLFFLSGSAPKPVAFRLRVALAVQVVVAIATASVRPYTELAFGILVPVFGLGLMGLWGGRHGTFGPRQGRA
jgi:hypothetical protein